MAPAPGHADVDASSAAGGFHDADAVVGGHPLVAVAGDGPAQLEVAGHVAGREAHLAALRIGDGERGVLAHRLDGPRLAVPDRRTSVGDQVGVIAPGGHLVPHEGTGAIGEGDRGASAPWVATTLDLDVDGPGGAGRGGGDGHAVSPAGDQLVLAGHPIGHQGGMDGLEPVPSGIGLGGRPLALAQGQACVGLPVVGEAVDLLEVMGR